MSKIIQFKNEQEEHCCPSCDLAEEYMDYVIDTETPSELFSVLRDLVQEAKDLGVKDYLVHELESKSNLLDYLEYGQFEDEDSN